MALIGCLVVVSSCSADDPHYVCEGNGDNRNHEYILALNLSKSGFSDQKGTRSASGWENGDKIYLLFSVDTLTTWGEALYKDGKWNLNYNGNIASDTLSRCQAVYLEHAGTESGMIINIGDSTAIYEDRNGSYYLKGDTLSVTASLKPKTGRMRFSGKNHDAIKVYGISYYTSYDYFKGTYTSSKAPLSLKVDDKYTPYVYGEFSDQEEPRLCIYTPSYGFTRHLPKTIYKPGESGFMTIPTPDNHEGWQNHVNLKINGVEFSMIPVEYSSGNFLLAETETTCELYKAITSSSDEASQYPVTNLNYDDCISFIDKIKLHTSLDFRLPSTSEWRFAYKGGAKSQKYKFSGSNEINDVAWYKDNSEGKIHQVKKLKPNELGFYDMSGNVSELTSYSVKSEYIGVNYHYFWIDYYYGGQYGSQSDKCVNDSYEECRGFGANSKIDARSGSNASGGFRIAFTY